MSTSNDAWRATVTKPERLGFVKALADILIKISNLKNNGKTDSDKLKQTAADYENNLYLSSTSKNNYFESITNRIEMTQDTYNKQQRQFMQAQQQKQAKQPRARPSNANNIVVNNLTINIPNQFQNGKFSFTEQQQTEILNELKYAPIPKELLSKIPNCPPNVTNWKEILQAGLANNDAVKSLYKYHQSYFFKVKRDEVLQKIQMSGLVPNVNAAVNNNTASNATNNTSSSSSNVNAENSARFLTPEQQKALLETAQVLLRNLQKQGKVPANLSNEEYNLYIKRYFNEFAQKRSNQLKQQQQQQQQQQATAPPAQNKAIDNQQLLQKLNEYFTSDEQKTLVGQAKAAIRASQQKGSISASLSTDEHQMLIKRYIYGVITKKEQQIQQRKNDLANNMSVDPKSQNPVQNNDYQQGMNTAQQVANPNVGSAAPNAALSNSQPHNPASVKSRPSAGSTTPLPTIKSNNPLFEDFSNLRKLGKIQKNIEVTDKKRKEIYHYSQADLFMETLNDTMFGLNNKKYQHQPMINLQPHVVDFINNTGKKKLTKALLKQRDQENIRVEVNKNTQSIEIDFKDQNILGMNNITTGNPLGLLCSHDYRALFDGLSNDTKVMNFLKNQDQIRSLKEDSLYAQPVPVDVTRKRQISYEVSANETMDLKKVKVSPSTEDIIMSNMIDTQKANGNISNSNTLVNNSILTDVSKKTTTSDVDVPTQGAPQRIKTPNPETDDPYTLEYWERVSKYENSLAT